MSNVEQTWKGLTVKGDLIENDWEGDPSVPNGTRTIPAYIEDLEVLTEDGYDIVNYLTDDAIDMIESYLIDTARPEDE